ncbi:hypothetical protein ACFVSC_25925, partial [Lysinibacillus xylanilyticus]
ITNKETGKLEMSTNFISYNGKLYKARFEIPLKNTDTNKNANVYIKDLHYDLTTGSVLVQVQGFEDYNYKLIVSDTTVKHKVLAMPITLKNDMYYSVPTELVQGNKFEVLLQDEHGKSIDAQEFTAPISTDWRYTDTVEDGKLQLDEEQTQQPQEQQQVPPGTQQGQQETQEATTLASSLLPEAMVPYKKEITIGIGVVVLLLIIILLRRMMKRRKARKAFENPDLEDNRYDEEEYPYEEDQEYDEEGTNEERKQENEEEFEDEHKEEGNFEDVTENQPPAKKDRNRK